MDIARQKNYELARNEMKKHIGKPLTHELIQSIHAIIIGPPGQQGYRTGFGAPQIRHEQIGRVIYWAANSGSGEMSIALQSLIDWYNEDQLKLPVEQLIAQLHWGIVKIHPFYDGNGRLARILTSFVLLDHGYEDTICRSLEEYFEIDRKAYEESLDDGVISYKGFKNVSSRWLDYICRSLYVASLATQSK